jgi:enterochelin esterase-like enzyme
MFIHFVCPRPNNARRQARPGRSTKSWPRDALEDASLVKFQAKNGGVFGLLLLIHLTGCDVVVPDDQYQLGPDSEIRLGVPQGAVRELTLPPSTVYPSYTHKAWLYIPALYSRPTPIALMVFQDGGTFVARDGPWRVPTVLDNLIQRKELPIMAAVFVDPGRSKHDDGLASEQRSFEYDTLSGQYAQFLLTEVLPEVSKSVQITDDPQGRGIGGLSSGGICAFTVAWQRPDAFSKVFSAIGSFVDIRGGGAYSELIRQADAKPLRVFLQDGTQDGLPGQFAGLDWPGGNRSMARALAFKDYDYQLVMGRGTHNPKHGASLFPAAMRWLWRDFTR